MLKRPGPVMTLDIYDPCCLAVGFFWTEVPYSLTLSLESRRPQFPRAEVMFSHHCHLEVWSSLRRGHRVVQKVVELNNTSETLQRLQQLQKPMSSVQWTVPGRCWRSLQPNAAAD